MREQVGMLGVTAQVSARILHHFMETKARVTQNIVVCACYSMPENTYAMVFYFMEYQ